MDKHWSAVCAVIVAFCTLMHFDTVFCRRCDDIVIEECPRNLNLALSRKGCKGCPRDHICCLSHGGLVCVRPVTPNPGVCPDMGAVSGVCGEFCLDDSDCSKKQKCCSNGCGHQCMAAVLEKPGVCPLRRWDDIGCFDVCSNDGDCPDQLKCCFAGCGRLCLPPLHR